MKHTSPIQVRINGTPYDYTMELDTDQAGSIVFTPDESAVRGNWPPMIAAPSVELIAALFYLRKMAEARARVVERAAARGRKLEEKEESRDMQAVINDATITVSATIGDYFLHLGADVESIVGTIPLYFAFSVAELSDILSYLAAVNETSRAMEDLDGNTSKLLTAVTEDEGRRA